MILLAVGATVLRLLLFLGRGHYVAFDEGWYLLLGRNLWSGDGYTLTGLQHVALSPLFPILSGAVDWVIGDAIWAGRLVAAVSSGLLVLPCWTIFRSLAGPTVASTGALFVVVFPSLAPFVVPYWIGWDLWVGAEPLLHLFLFSGIAFFLCAWEDRSWATTLCCGAAFALAYLARPEAVVAFGLLGVGALAFGALSARAKNVDTPPPLALAARAGGCAVVFLILAAPYWLYLHDSLDRWTITGRAVQLVPETRPRRVEPREAVPNRIETMLWQGDSSPYIRRLYALDSSATQLANSYWGMQQGGATEIPDADGGSSAMNLDAGGSTDSPDTASSTISSPLLRYAEALGVAVPWYVWLIAVPGLLAPGRDRRLDLEALVGIPLVATSVLIAGVVAIDPRTQLFIAPLAAFYAARGVLVVADRISERMGEHVRREIVTRILVGAVAAVMLGTSAVRLTMSLTVGSPHHVVAAENAVVGEAIRETTAENATVMSFHPALALFADRDWRVLPLEPMDRIVRYARTQPSPHLVLSVFYPPELRPAEEPHYLIVPVPDELPEAARWRIDIPEMRTIYAFGELVPAE